MDAFIYQARSLVAADDTGLSDPYCEITCGKGFGRTEITYETLNPIWNQRLSLTGTYVCYGSPHYMTESPPVVSINIWDWDRFVSPTGPTKKKK